MQLDAALYRTELEQARLRLAVFDPSKHPRGWAGRFRKGMRVKGSDGKPIGKMVSIDHAKGTMAVVTPSGQMSSRYVAGVAPVSEQPPDIGALMDGASARVWGVHHGVNLDLGDKLNAGAVQEIVRAVDKALTDPALSQHKTWAGADPGVAFSIKAASSIPPGDEFDGGALAFMQRNPATTFVQHRGLGGRHTIYVNDLGRADEMNRGDMRSLTNPKRDKHVSAAHTHLGSLVTHEIGHVHQDVQDGEAYQQGDRAREARWTQLYNDYGKDWIDKNVSWYAAQSPVEFYAEAYALLHSDVKLKSAVREKLEAVVFK